MTAIKTLKFTVAQKLVLDQKLIEANIVFRKYFELVKSYLLDQSMLGVHVNLKYGKMKFKKELEIAFTNNPNNIVVRTVEVSREDYDKIFSIKGLENEVLAVYANLLCKQAHVWSKRSYGQFDFEEAYQECVIAALTAMWGGFSKNNIRFITFLHRAIQNRFYYVMNQTKQLSPWSFDDRKLLGEFKKMQALNPDATFDSITNYLNFNKDQIDNLKCMLRTVNNESVLQSDHGDNEFDLNNLVQLQKEEPDFDMMTLLNEFEMSDWERICINAFLKGRRGWATEVAAENINPLTGDVYSRAAPKLAIDRVLERFKNKYFSLSKIN